MGFSANIVSNTYDNERGVIVFDKDISAISEYAFYGCTKLTSIQMPSSVAEIKDYAFSNTSISEISIPVNVTIIADGAFEYCDNITTIDIPNNVALVGDYAFNGCENVTFQVVNGSKGYDFVKRMGYNFETDGNVSFFERIANFFDNILEILFGWIFF
jgi:hypothetical protein